MKVLVVDDDAAQREMRALLLVRHGFDALEAGDRATALRLAAEQHPRAVVLDLRLPAFDDGLALIRDLNALDAQMRLLVLTGSSRSAFESHAESELVEILLIKPVATTALVSQLRSRE